MSDWIERFFDDYAEAFRTEPKDKLLRKFHLPLTFLTKKGPIALDNEERLAANLNALVLRYKEIGAVDWKYTIKDVKSLAVGITLAELEWRFYDSDNGILYFCDTSYVLTVESETDARIMAVISHNENEEYQKARNKKYII